LLTAFYLILMKKNKKEATTIYKHLFLIGEFKLTV
jgi:hypothetical protein